jgi:hypothetical protein
MESSGMLRHVALVITDVSEELSTSIIKVTRIGELGKLASNCMCCDRLRVQYDMYFVPVLSLKPWFMDIAH